MNDDRIDAENRSRQRPMDTRIEKSETATPGKRSQYERVRPAIIPAIPGQVEMIIPCLNIVLLIRLGGAPTVRMIPKSRLLFSKAKFM